MEKTKFYELSVKARHDETALIFVIDKIMPKINKCGLSTLFCTIFIRTLFYIQLALNNQVNYVF